MSLTFKLSDTIPKPSIPIEELNNALVKMRKAVKAAKVLTFRDMMRYLKLLKKKVERDSQNIRLKNKLEHRSLELSQLRGLTVSRLCKLLMTSDYAANALSREGSRLSGQDRLIIRLSRTKPVDNYLQLFREQHPDWRSLGQYLLYKNISGKWKSREQKRRNRRVHGSLPLPKPPSNQHGDDERIADQTLKTTTCYRIQQVDSSENPTNQTAAALGSHSPFHLDADDIDSDAASDIADQVVSRLRARAKNEPADAVVLTTKSVDDTIGGCGTASSSSQIRYKKKKTFETAPAVRQTLKETNGAVLFGDGPTAENKQREDIDEDYDDDPFGSDDVALRKSLSRGARKRLLGNSMSALAPLVQQKSWSKQSMTKRHNTQIECQRNHHVGKSMTSVKPKDSHKESNENLHPSWQAKREQKLRLSAIENLVHPASSHTKHTVFED